MQNENEAPEEVFAWLQSLSYQHLSAEKKVVVDCYFTPEEYDDMHMALEHAATSVQQADNSRYKLTALSSFDAYHNSRSSFFNFSNLRFAAVILPVIILLALLWFVKPLANSSVSEVADTDTVYVSRNLTSKSTVVVHDTVYLEKNNSRSQKSEKKRAVRNSFDSGYEELSGLKLEEQFNEENALRGNNMRDDSLWSAFPPVTL